MTLMSLFVSLLTAAINDPIGFLSFTLQLFKYGLYTSFLILCSCCIEAMFCCDGVAFNVVFVNDPHSQFRCVLFLAGQLIAAVFGISPNPQLYQLLHRTTKPEWDFNYHYRCEFNDLPLISSHIVISVQNNYDDFLMLFVTFPVVCMLVGCNQTLLDLMLMQGLQLND